MPLNEGPQISITEVTRSEAKWAKERNPRRNEEPRELNSLLISHHTRMDGMYFRAMDVCFANVI